MTSEAEVKNWVATFVSWVAWSVTDEGTKSVTSGFFNTPFTTPSATAPTNILPTSTTSSNTSVHFVLEEGVILEDADLEGFKDEVSLVDAAVAIASAVVVVDDVDDDGGGGGGGSLLAEGDDTNSS